MGLCLYVLEYLQLTRHTFFEADIIDQKREEEERALLMAEEKEQAKEKLAPASGKPRLPIKAGKTASLHIQPTIRPAMAPSLPQRKTLSECE